MNGIRDKKKCMTTKRSPHIINVTNVVFYFKLIYKWYYYHLRNNKSKVSLRC